MYNVRFQSWCRVHESQSISRWEESSDSNLPPIPCLSTTKCGNGKTHPVSRCKIMTGSGKIMLTSLNLLFDALEQVTTPFHQASPWSGPRDYSTARLRPARSRCYTQSSGPTHWLHLATYIYRWITSTLIQRLGCPLDTWTDVAMMTFLSKSIDQSIVMSWWISSNDRSTCHPKSCGNNMSVIKRSWKTAHLKRSEISRSWKSKTFMTLSSFWLCFQLRTFQVF